MGKIQEPLPPTIGPYAIVRCLGSGGMGEVFLAEDPAFGRMVALKRIRPDLRNNKTLQNRFLREAQVASVLSHPSIIPILTIQTTPPDIYYTMPFVAGQTLRQVLKSKDPQSYSIPTFARIFLQMCEAIAYTHAKGILHRDLKPDNIIIGKYGEVMILDWGIADFLNQIEKQEPVIRDKISDEALTRPGKITGTLAYMAPERLLGKSSSVQTDLYALGVILYQMLTLQLPFQRKSLAAFRKQVQSEQLIDPIEMAPYRDIPRQLSLVCQRCLAKEEKERYASMDALIAEIKNFIEGRAEWILASELAIARKNDWQFQENILLAKNIAITQKLDATQWAELMISKNSFADNIRIEAELRLSEKGQGLGFLFSMPEESRGIEEGYCLWASPIACKFFRNHVQMLEAQILQPKKWMKICIEKVDEHVKFFVDGQLKFSYASHLPLAGHRIGLLLKDDHFDLKDLKIYDGGHNVLVGCLAVPNAFLSRKLYEIALQEYRRIGACFPGRMEGREALFRAGLTLIEKARAEENDRLYHAALQEFEKLARTPGAPLEYLGKSMVYKALGDFEEEAKCLELALRKFPQHPLLSMLFEHIVYRMHESSLNNREAAYRSILLAIRHIPDLLDNPDTQHLIESLERNWEPLSFIKPSADRLNSLAIILAFWLAKVPILVEIANRVKNNETLLDNALMCLQELEANDALAKFLPKKAPRKKTLTVWNLLLQKKLDEAKAIFDQFPEAQHQETSPLHFPYGTYLYLTAGEKAAQRHFASVLETQYPRTTALPSLFLTNRLTGWIERAFWWEKKELHRQIELFYRCVGKPE